MPADSIRFRISTPTGPIPPGRGFYQLEEDALYVQVGLYSARRQFFSYVEGEQIRFDLDKEGRLIFFELAVARRQWPVAGDGLLPPSVVEPADIRWLDFRSYTVDPEILASADRTTLRLAFSNNPAERNYYLADEVVVSVDAQDRLVHLWVGHIIDDIAGQEIGAFRKKYRGNGSFFA